MRKLTKVTLSTSTKRSPHALTMTRYAELKRDVQQLAAVADKVTNQAKVVAFWRLGRRIARERLKKGSGYHNAVLRDLAADTGVVLRNLQYAVSFHQCYASAPKQRLSWAHYRILLDRPDATSRATYEARAIAGSLSSHDLARLISSDDRKVTGDAALKRPTQPSYLYRATLDQIIDGDTFDLSIDLGFHVDRRGRFRLADIDCPELPSPSARAARDFVFNCLGSAKTIVVKTQRTDLHGRYVTHLFYSPAEVSIDVCFSDGTYLNNELVDAGHAVIALQ